MQVPRKVLLSGDAAWRALSMGGSWAPFGKALGCSRVFLGWSLYVIVLVSEPVRVSEFVRSK